MLLLEGPLAVTHLSVWLGSDPAATNWGLVGMILVGMVAITKGGDLFTDSSVDIARMTRIPTVIIGATIVSMATSFPEFMVSVTGTLAGTTDFAVGNAIGSCICNIGLVIGFCAIFEYFLARRKKRTPGIEAKRSLLTGPGGYMLMITIATWLAALFLPGQAAVHDQPAAYGIARWEGMLLLGVMVVYLGYSVRSARQARGVERDPDSEDDGKFTWSAMLKAGFIFLLGTAVVVVGSRLLVANGERAALLLGVPELIVGLTLFAVGTSLPELAITVIAVIKGQDALGLGNILGSNVLNITWVLATCAVLKPLPIGTQTVLVDLPVCLMLTVLLLTMPWKSERISIGTGATLLGCYVIYLAGITIKSLS